MTVVTRLRAERPVTGGDVTQCANDPTTVDHARIEEVFGRRHRRGRRQPHRWAVRDAPVRRPMEYLDNADGDGHPGIVRMDFPGCALVDDIIARNDARAVVKVGNRGL
ncbi:hypothetical protein ACFV9E_36615 [Streptomyces sp. NPDC059835]|uniref:hypothetical protein n=1 Tax=Streptomyces sp. NPDC059835 TaxID=3346967 RepID=UPI003658D9ED